VAEIFSDMALMVAEQGEHIDNIQTHIESAAYQTNKGVKELAKASRSQKKARGRMCCVAVMLIILLIVLTLVLKFAAHAI
jgi:t-SNARE complex subunit (syntaxin)